LREKNGARRGGEPVSVAGCGLWEGCLWRGTALFPGRRVRKENGKAPGDSLTHGDREPAAFFQGGQRG